MRQPTPPRPDRRRRAPTAARLGAGLAQAAGLAISSGSVDGSLTFHAGANGAQLANGASIADASGPDFLRGVGRLDASNALAGAGRSTTLGQLWSGSASLDASDARRLRFAIGATSMLTLSGNGQFGGGTDLSNLLLDAELAVTSTGDAVGTAVRLVFSGTAESRVNTTGPLLDVTPTFDLVVRDGMSNILASWQGLAVGSSATFSVSLDTRVGDSLSFSLSHDSTSLLGSASSLAAGGDTLETTALLSGTVQVTAVPEPESYALFLAGLAALGLLHKRQSQRRR